MLTVLNVNDSGRPLMSRTRLFTDSNLGPGAEILLSGDAARYLGRVLRLRPDDEVTVFNGDGGEYEATVVSLAKSSVTLRTGNFIDREAESPLSIHLVQGLARGERMDLVVQKATELGVDRITPLMTEYGVVRLDGQRAAKRTAHWRAVAASACEQSGRNRLPVIDEPIGFREWLGGNSNRDWTRLILRPGAGRSLASASIESGCAVLLIGPEGGFSEAEYELAELTGFAAIGLGPRILRTETAALAAMSALQVLHGDMA